ncbi:MAG: hypothetical protein Q9187_006857 [Circinaria calcarea]
MSTQGTKSNVRRHGRQSLAMEPLNNQAPLPLGVQRKQSFAPFPKSARLQEKQRLRQQLGSQEQVRQLLSPTSDTPGKKLPRDSSVSRRPSIPDQTRKRSRSEEVVPRPVKEDHRQKRHRSSSIKPVAEGSASLEYLIVDNPVDYWTRKYTWPPEYFEMSQPFLRKRSASTRSLESELSGETPKDLPREAKSAPYKDGRYETHLATRGAFMEKPPVKIDDRCKDLCRRLLDSKQPIVKDSLFHDDRFETICSLIRNENEARIIQDITRLIVPSAETLSVYGATNPDILIEKVNSSWLKCIPLTDTRPQPDYSVGFRASAFTKNQLDRLSPFVGGYKDQCSVMAREDMYFPFLTCEVKCGDQALNIADRQNMHSASVSVKGLVELFKRIKREGELHRKILAFSVSHDNEAVRIYGHYALINGTETGFYRHAIHKFDITALDGKDRWTAYQFTRNVYDLFVPIHLERIRAAVDQLPDPDVFAWSLFSRVSNAESIQQQDGQSPHPYSQESAPRLPSSQTSGSVFKKPKERSAKE